MVKPYVRVFVTVSLDGGLGYVGEKTVLSSDRDLHRLHYLRSISDAVMVGANTVLVDNPSLTVRSPGYSGRQPYRVVVDRDLKTRPEHRVYDTSVASSILVTKVGNENHRVVEELSRRGVGVVYAPLLEDGSLDLGYALNELNDSYGVKSVLAQGGGFLIASLIKQNLVDELVVTIAPTLLGLNKVNFINATLGGPVKLSLRKLEVDHVSGEVTLTYTVIERGETNAYPHEPQRKGGI